VGFRTIDVDWPIEHQREVTDFLQEVVRSAEYYGVAAQLLPVAGIRYEIHLDGNSSYLNDMTEVLCATVTEIAGDCCESAFMLHIASTIGEQLREQMVDWSGVEGITPGRTSRETFERMHGEFSPDDLLQQVHISASRVAELCTRYAACAGLTAWYDRRALQTPARIDALALISAGRRFLRSVHDLAERLGDDHLRRVMSNLNMLVADLRTIRDVSEHLDEYSMGRGWRDSATTEPGPVVTVSLGPSGIIVGARGATVALREVAEKCDETMACVHASIEHKMPQLWVRALIEDVQFTTPNGDLIALSAEDSHHAEVRHALAQPRRQLALTPTRCTKCGEMIT